MAILKGKISEEELKQVNGGTVVHIPEEAGMNYEHWVIVEDQTGSYRDICTSESTAKKRARYKGFSDEVISLEEYKNRYGKTL